MNDLFRSQFRLPQELADQLRRAAESSGRSMNAEVVARLESTFAASTATPAADLSQTVQELQSLQQLGTLNYELQRATHNLDTARQKFGAACAALQQALASGDQAAQKAAKEQCKHWQSASNDLNVAIAEIEAQIELVHFDRKINGLKELRYAQTISTSVMY